MLTRRNMLGLLALVPFAGKMVAKACEEKAAPKLDETFGKMHALGERMKALGCTAVLVKFPSEEMERAYRDWVRTNRPA